MKPSRMTYYSTRITMVCLLAAMVVSVGMIGTECPPGGETPMGNDGLTGKFVGSERCAQCHSRVHENWLSTLHAGALDTLEAIGQDTNENCIGCHVVGFGQEGGFVDRATTNALAGVGCEACHGPSRDHVENVQDESLRPPKNIAASVCGQCHTGSHHPNFEEWQMAGHSSIDEHVSESFEAGTSLNSCGKCHSGDFYYLAIIEGETVEDDFLMGVTRENQNGITCVICHDPHQQTGNAAAPDEGRDFQLRYPEVASPVPTNTIDAATNAARFNICGQCHHSRGRTWVDNARGPHHSVQSNVYVGEMPMPDSDAPVTPLVPSRFSVHALAAEQCATCHMYRQDFMDEQAPAIAGHTFQPNNAGCAATGCHPSTEAAVAAQSTLQTEVDTRLAAILMRLDAFSKVFTEGGMLTGTDAWEYTSGGGPSSADQVEIPERVRKVRFMIKYIEGDGSRGIHNPDYVRSMLDECEDLLDDEGL